jgi:2-polyprenyl-3-methyl-5-hydroxy-6-metoxy-1,4-benzoquinol methylase
MNNYFETRFKEDSRRKFIWEQIAKYVDKIDPGKKSVLEIGAGYSDWINATNAPIRIASDLSDNVAKFATPPVKFIKMSATNLGDLNGQNFDRIQLSNLLEHLDYSDVLLAVQEISTHLEKNGTVVIIQPNYRYSFKTYFDDYTHRTIFTHISLCDLFSANGFEVVKVEKRFLPFSLKSKLGIGYKLINLYF